MEILLRFLKGAVKSETVRTNSILMILWAAVMQSGLLEHIMQSEVIQSNPQMLAWVLIAQNIMNILYRAKTGKPLLER